MPLTVNNYRQLTIIKEITAKSIKNKDKRWQERAIEVRRSHSPSFSLILMALLNNNKVGTINYFN